MPVEDGQALSAGRTVRFPLCILEKISSRYSERQGLMDSVVAIRCIFDIGKNSLFTKEQTFCIIKENWSS